MASPEEVNLSQFKTIHHQVTPGEGGVKSAGELFLHAAGANEKAAAANDTAGKILYALTPGEAGKRGAGHILALLARIEGNTAVIQNLVTALANVSGGEAFDQAKLLAGIDQTVRSAMADTVKVEVSVGGTE